MNNKEEISRPQKYRRVKTPALIQMEATECGAVALGIVLAYYGKYISIEDLRIACGISRDGSNAANMVEAAEGYGMKAEGYSLDVDDLYELQLPSILFWKFTHFVVLEGFGKDRVYINDPATGPRTITYEELDAAFTGVAITMEPTAEFKKGGSPPELVSAVWRRLKYVKSTILYATIVGLCMVIPDLAFPALTQVFIDQVLVKGELDWRNGLLFGMLLVIVVKGMLTFLQGKVVNRLKTRMSIALNSETLWHMLRLPMEFYLQRYPGEVAYRLSLNESINHVLVDNVLTIFLSLIFALAYGFAIFYYDPIISLVGMGVIAANLALMRYVYRSRADVYARYQADVSRSASYSIGALENMETLKASGSYLHFFGVWAAYYTKVLNSMQDLGRKDAYIVVCTFLLQSFSYFVFLSVGGWRVLDGQITVGMFLAVQILLFSMIQPVMHLAGASQSLQLLKVDMARLDDLITYPIDRQFSHEAKSAEVETEGKLSGRVEVRDLSFGYSLRAPPLLEGINFTMEPGKSIALVGNSGSGKSTLAKLIAGLLYPWSGEVLLDGKTAEKISRRSRVDSIALIEQDPFVFSAIVKDNITFLDESVPSQSLVKAAELACLHDTIVQRPGKYDMRIEENGTNLSGGERQRLEIARALLKNPSILIMDEGTNSLDAHTESLIIQNIRRSGCAVLLIAHRLSSIRHCDEIIVLEKGKIISRGTHEELKISCRMYRDLVEAESGVLKTHE